MAENTIVAQAPPECVWKVLGDPDTYEMWVVGTKAVVDWDDAWPAPGSRFRHEQGVGPVTVLTDETEVIEAEPERRLLLEARMRPVVLFRIELVLEPLGAEQTRIRMNEWPVGGPLGALRPLLEPGIRVRNSESVERLAKLAEQRWRGRRSATTA